MATISEDYVSFDTAKLLKEKGFDLLTDKVYDNQNKLDYQNVVCWQEKRLPYVLAPTLQMAMKWLREIHNLQIQIAPINSKYKDWTFGIYKDFSSLTLDLICCPTYEEACESAIKYCLENLI